MIPIVSAGGVDVNITGEVLNVTWLPKHSFYIGNNLVSCSSIIEETLAESGYRCTVNFPWNISQYDVWVPINPQLLEAQLNTTEESVRIRVEAEVRKNLYMKMYIFSGVVVFLMCSGIGFWFFRYKRPIKLKLR